jgi:hypothetical protein
MAQKRTEVDATIQHKDKKTKGLNEWKRSKMQQQNKEGHKSSVYIKSASIILSLSSLSPTIFLPHQLLSLWQAILTIF